MFTRIAEGRTVNNRGELKWNASKCWNCVSDENDSISAVPVQLIAGIHLVVGKQIDDQIFKIQSLDPNSQLPKNSSCCLAVFA